MSPKVFSNDIHAAVGKYIYGKVESRNAAIEEERREMLVLVVMLSICTVKSRSSTALKSKVKLFGVNFDESYPPRVRLPRTAFNPKCDVNLLSPVILMRLELTILIPCCIPPGLARYHGLIV